jgi:predicted house-cleaning noncanonical NTP pyrophosphatase (MazG superfamily)
MRTKRDKIFDNTFEDGEFDMDAALTFEVAPSYLDNRDEEDKIESAIVRDSIHELILASRFKQFNTIDDFQQTVKLKKIEINEVYEYISDEMRSNHSIIEIYSELCDYFNINPTKFYASLGNKFKEELIDALDKKTNVLKKKNINKLF